MFQPLSETIRTKVSVEIVEIEVLEQAISFNHVKDKMTLGSLPEFLCGDVVRLKQILINLVKNALKFTIKGTIRIIVAYDNSNEILKVHVVDTGKGIKEEDFGKLF